MQSQIVIDRFLRNDLSQNLNAFERILLVILASYMGKKTSCFPSHQTLARNCGMSIDTVRRNIRSLEKKELILIKHTHGRNNIYTLNLSKFSLPANSSYCSEQVPADSMHHSQPAAITPLATSTTNNISNNIIKNTSDFKKQTSVNRTIEQKTVKLANGLFGGYENE